MGRDIGRVLLGERRTGLTSPVGVLKRRASNSRNVDAVRGVEPESRDGVERRMAGEDTAQRNEDSGVAVVTRNTAHVLSDDNIGRTRCTADVDRGGQG